GIAGLLGLGVDAMRRGLIKICPQPIAAAILSLLFVGAAVGNFVHEERRGRVARGYFTDVLGEYRNFLSELQSLPDAATASMLYYTALPRHMDEGTILSATQFALSRMDIET